MRSLSIFLIVIITASCDGSGREPDRSQSARGGQGGKVPLATTNAIRLSPANPYTQEPKDEDSNIIRAHSGRYFMSWMSNRNGGNDDIHMIYSDDGMSWSDPIRVTQHTDADWYPTLLQDTMGKFHLVWMRQELIPPFARHTYYSSSMDGITWDRSHEVALTSGSVDDFVPHIVEHNKALFIYFGSRVLSQNATEDIFYMRSTDGGAHWSAPAVVVRLSTDSQMDTFPYVINDPDSGGLFMVWVRYDGSFSSPVLPYLPDYNSPTSDLFYSTSADGISWTLPVQITSDVSDGTTDSIGSVYVAHGEKVLTWMHAVGTSPHIMEYPFKKIATYPNGILDVTDHNGKPGWSPRVAPTHTDDVFIRTWVTASKEVYYQIFSR